MRARTDLDFCEYLLRIGERKEKVNEHCKIEIPKSFRIHLQMRKNR